MRLFTLRVDVDFGGGWGHAQSRTDSKGVGRVRPWVGPGGLRACLASQLSTRFSPLNVHLFIRKMTGSLFEALSTSHVPHFPAEKASGVGGHERPQFSGGQCPNKIPQ